MPDQEDNSISDEDWLEAGGLAIAIKRQAESTLSVAQELHKLIEAANQHFMASATRNEITEDDVTYGVCTDQIQGISLLADDITEYILNIASCADFVIKELRSKI